MRQSTKATKSSPIKVTPSTKHSLSSPISGQSFVLEFQRYTSACCEEGQNTKIMCNKENWDSLSLPLMPDSLSGGISRKPLKPRKGKDEFSSFLTSIQFAAQFESQNRTDRKTAVAPRFKSFNRAVNAKSSLPLVPVCFDDSEAGQVSLKPRKSIRLHLLR